MNQDKLTKEAFLFPRVFKKISFFMIPLVILIIALILRLIVPKGDIAQRELIKTIGFNLILLALFFIVWSRDKIEDERTVRLRLRALAYAFIFSVVYVVIYPIVGIVLFGDPGELLTINKFLISFFSYCFINYELFKRGWLW